jgi:hypothetical protein
VTCEPHVSDAFLLGAREFIYILSCKEQGNITIVLKILGVTVQNLVSCMTWCLEIVPLWSAFNKRESPDLKCEN